MKLEYGFLAEAANVLENGLFDVVSGGFDVVKGRRFPATKGVLVVVGRLRFEAAECDKPCQLSAQIVSRSGGEVLSDLQTEAFTPPPHPRHPERGNSITVCLKFIGVAFPAPGDYLFSLSFEGRNVGEVAFEAVSEEEPK